MMVSSLALVGVLSLSATTALAQYCTPCEPLHMFLWGGNNEPYPGRQGDLVAAICDGLPDGYCGYEDIIYSHLYTDLSCQTTYSGSVNGIEQMTSYASRCPNSKLVMLGYSQGAQIVTDVLGGGGGLSFGNCSQPPSPALDKTTSPGDKVAAALVFGNTRHTANQPYNFANGSSLNGLFPRTDPAQLAALSQWTGILRDWCQYEDPICTGNHTGVEVSVHLGYYKVDTQSAASYVKSVAQITATGTFQTTIPTQVSGTAQNYATIPSTFQPSGTVTTSATIAPATTCPTSVSAVLAQASSTSGAFSFSNGTTITSKASSLMSSISASNSAMSSGAASAIASAVSSAVSSGTASGTTSSTSPVATDNNNAGVRTASGFGFAGLAFLVAAIAL